MNIIKATPVEIDTEIARLSSEIDSRRSRVRRIVGNVLDNSGLRKYVTTTRSGGTQYKVIGTFQEGVKKLRDYEVAYAAYRAADYDATLRPEPLSNYAGGVDVEQLVTEKASLDAQISDLYKLVAELENEYVARGHWSRMFLVTSSNGHIHSTTLCQTTRATTTFGWMPEYSGLSEDELLAKLGVYAETACTVCYSKAPANKKKKLTVAKANKMIAGPVLND